MLTSCEFTIITIRSSKMANKQQILDKIARNLTMRGVTAARSGDTVLVTKTGGDVLTVSYVDKVVQAPMGGVDASSSPFLGIGVAAPGALKVKGEAGVTTVAGLIDTVEAVALMVELAGFGNDIILENGSNTTQIARIAGDADRQGMGM